MLTVRTIIIASIAEKDLIGILELALRTNMVASIVIALGPITSRSKSYRPGSFFSGAVYNKNCMEEGCWLCDKHQ